MITLWERITYSFESFTFPNIYILATRPNEQKKDQPFCLAFPQQHRFSLFINKSHMSNTRIGWKKNKLTKLLIKMFLSTFLQDKKPCYRTRWTLRCSLFFYFYHIHNYIGVFCYIYHLEKKKIINTRRKFRYCKGHGIIIFISK